VAESELKTEIIAEIGQNHNGDMALAVELIKAAKGAGADVAKFQVYDARALFPPKEENPWFDYNCQTELSKDDVFRLKAVCDDVGIEFLASVFDVSVSNGSRRPACSATRWPPARSMTAS
jgi:N-acetylneuraminate synthase/N,N'-diacetyllegionaminate synthase